MEITARLSVNVHCAKCEHAMVHGGVLLICCNPDCEYMGLMFEWPEIEQLEDIKLKLAIDAIAENERATGRKDKRAEAIENDRDRDRNDL